MQNKPNFQKAEMSVTSFLTKDYDYFVALRLSKNKAKQSQSAIGGQVSEDRRQKPALSTAEWMRNDKVKSAIERV